jgi:streptogramin lyase
MDRIARFTRAVLLLMMAGCSSDATAPERLLPSSEPLARKERDDISAGALMVGNFQPPIGAPTNGILRFNAKTGASVDNFVPEGTGGLTIGCCMTYGPDEHLYVTSPLTSSVLRFNGATGDFIDEFVPPSGGGLVTPLSPVFHDGSLFVGDFGTHGIHRFDAETGHFLGMFVPAGSRGMTDGDPQLFTFGPDGHLYVAAPSLNRILRYNGRTGKFIDEFVKPKKEDLEVVSGLTFGPDGNLYVGSGNGVNRYDGRTGKFIDYFVKQGSGGLAVPVEVLFGPDQNLYVASAESGDVLRYDGRTGSFIDAFVPAGRGGINGPRQMLFKLTITLCHRGETITVGQLAAEKRVKRGDTVGPCPERDDEDDG